MPPAAISGQGNPRSPLGPDAIGCTFEDRGSPATKLELDRPTSWTPPPTSRARKTIPIDVRVRHRKSLERAKGFEPSTPTLARSGCLSRAWCGRRDSNPHSHREADFLTTSAFAAAVWRSWSGLSLRHGVSAEGATHPVSTPSPSRGFGSGLAWGMSPLAFPDFERFYSVGFPTGTPIEVCCVYRFRHVRVVIVVPLPAIAG